MLFLASSFDYVTEILNSENRVFPADIVQRRKCEAWPAGEPSQPSHAQRSRQQLLVSSNTSASKNLALD